MTPTHPWTAQGTTYQARTLTLMAWAAIAQHVRDRTPDPFRELCERIRDLPLETAKIVFDAEHPRLPAWPPRPGTPRFFETLIATDGLGLVVFHALRRSVPTFTREQADAIAADLDMDETIALLAIAFGAGAGGSATTSAEPADVPAA